jgi:hypothetical protein
LLFTFLLFCTGNWNVTKCQNICYSSFGCGVIADSVACQWFFPIKKDCLIFGPTVKKIPQHSFGLKERGKDFQDMYETSFITMVVSRYGKAEIINSDQGSKFTGDGYVSFVKA